MIGKNKSILYVHLYVFMVDIQQYILIGQCINWWPMQLTECLNAQIGKAATEPI